MNELPHIRISREICIYLAEFVGDFQRAFREHRHMPDIKYVLRGAGISVFAEQLERVLELLQRRISSGDYWFTLNRVGFPSCREFSIGDLKWYRKSEALPRALSATIETFWKFLDCPASALGKRQLGYTVKGEEKGDVSFRFNDEEYYEVFGGMQKEYLELQDLLSTGPECIEEYIEEYSSVLFRKYKADRQEHCIFYQEFISRYWDSTSARQRILWEIVNRIAYRDFWYVSKHFFELKNNLISLRSALHGKAHLGLNWDEHLGQVTRVGYDDTVSFGRAVLQQRMFKFTLEAGGKGIDKYELSSLLHNGVEKRLDSTKTELNCKLEPLDVLVELEKGKYFLSDMEFTDSFTD